MLEAIRNTNPNSDYMYVVDTRPRVGSIINYYKPHFSNLLLCWRILSITLPSKFNAKQSF